MGLFGSSKQPPAPPPMMAPSPIPIGVIPAFTQHQTQMALKIREKKLSFGGDDFAVKDAVTGQKIFSVDGKVFSMHSKKDVYDAAGKKLYTLKKKMIALHTTYDGVAPTEEVLFTIKGGFGLGAKLTITFKNLANAGEDAKLHLKGDWLDRSASITNDQGLPVAQISRSFLNAGELFFDNQTYFLQSELADTRNVAEGFTRLIPSFLTSQLHPQLMHHSCLPSASASTRRKMKSSKARPTSLQCNIVRHSHSNTQTMKPSVRQHMLCAFRDQDIRIIGGNELTRKASLATKYFQTRTCLGYIVL